MTKDKKIRIALIAICIVIFVLLILFIFYLLFNKGASGKSKVDELRRLNGVYIGEDMDFEVNSISTERCNEDNSICITGLELVSEGKKGIITYIVHNNTDSVKSGRLKVTLGDYTFIFPYSDVYPAEDPSYRIKKQVYGYEGFDLDFTVIADYTVEDAQSDDDALMFERMTPEQREDIIVN